MTGDPAHGRHARHDAAWPAFDPLVWCMTGIAASPFIAAIVACAFALAACDGDGIGGDRLTPVSSHTPTASSTRPARQVCIERAGQLQFPIQACDDNRRAAALADCQMRVCVDLVLRRGW